MLQQCHHTELYEVLLVQISTAVPAQIADTKAICRFFAAQQKQQQQKKKEKKYIDPFC